MFFYALASILLFVAHCRSTESGHTVVASTSMIGTIVKEVGKERVNVITIVPAGMCPGQFDLKPGELKAASNAPLVLMHGWEQWMGDLVLSISERDSKVRRVPVTGSWMIPSVHLEAVDWIVEALSDVDFEAREFFHDNAIEYKRRVMDSERKLEERREAFSDIPVISNQHQSEFLEWLGFRVVSTFASHWDAAPRELAEIVRTARRENAVLIVDNLQDNTKTGRVIAKTAERIHVVLTNFPVKGSYTDAVNGNVSQLLEALHLSREQE